MTPTAPTDKDNAQLSVRPYLLRAWYDWCVDQNLTPYITVFVDQMCTLPMQFVQQNMITLNLAPHAIIQLQLKHIVSFSARFSGVSQEVIVPVGNITSIFASENQIGMSFPYVCAEMPIPPKDSAKISPSPTLTSAPPSGPSKPLRKGHLTLIK